MSTKIGLRVYQMTICRKGKPEPLPLNASGTTVPLPEFVARFVGENAKARTATPEETERERRWRFQPRITNSTGNNKGTVQYGITGFESDIVDPTTNKRAFRRLVKHVENVPLFYEFWFPSESDYGFAAFQSFASRSCVELIMDQLRADFASANPGFILRVQKLMPTGAGGIYDAAPVKGLRLIKRNAPSDVADRYVGNGTHGAINFQVVLSARPKSFLGRLGDLTNSMKAANGGVVQHDGVTFDAAVAEIDFGGQRRRVGMFGPNREAGVIDLTDSIKRGTNGHPTFQTISEESTKLLTDFHSYLKKRKKP